MDLAHFLQFFESIPLWVVFLVPTLASSALTILIYNSFKAGKVRYAQLQAEEFVQAAKDKSELQDIELQEKFAEIEEQIWKKVEEEHLKLEEHIEDLEEKSKSLKQKLDNQYSQIRQKTAEAERELKSNLDQLQEHTQKVEVKRTSLATSKEKLVSRLSEVSQTSASGVSGRLVQQHVNEPERRSAEKIELAEKEARDQSEILAKKILDHVHNRFLKGAPTERGIGSVYFESPEQQQLFLDEKGENLKVLQEITGCDFVIDPNNELFGVAGIDPVRRELARRILERLLKEKKKIQPELIKKVGENIKKELMNQIKRDGDQLAKELGLRELHPEVRQVMGSLRYRYSYTQNQYFHCGEVGWLCGLLATELGGVSMWKARRAGMLHDLGKAMDHEIDGGHAVIGADFIKTRGEGPEIVHAVKAHHYDEDPSTDLAYLVIAADAISGARPGARRSTVEAYNQKVSALDSIARGFPGVIDCSILSGGRELRVLVNSRQVSDRESMALSKKIADQIQAEMNYPGTIKVVVVRNSFANFQTKQEARA